jgi:hypothetical protein
MMIFVLLCISVLLVKHRGFLLQISSCFLAWQRNTFILGEIDFWNAFDLSIMLKSPSLMLKSQSLMLKSPFLMLKLQFLMVKSPLLMLKLQFLMDKSQFLMVKSQFLMDKSPLLMVKSPFLMDKSPLLMVKSPFLMLKLQFLMVKSQFLMVKSPFLMLKLQFLMDKSPLLMVKSLFLIVKSPFLMDNSCQLQAPQPRDVSFSYHGPPENVANVAAWSSRSRCAMRSMRDAMGWGVSPGPAFPGFTEAKSGFYGSKMDPNIGKLSWNNGSAYKKPHKSRKILLDLMDFRKYGFSIGI